MSEPLTRFEAQRRLIEIGMPANVAADYLTDDPPFNAKSMLSLAYLGAWPILEAYRRHCAGKSAGEPSAPVASGDSAKRVDDGSMGGYLSSDDCESANDAEKRADPAKGRASDKAAGIREGWHRNAECCEWHRTGGKTRSQCNAIAYRGTIATTGIVGVMRDPFACLPTDKQTIGLPANADALRSIVADKAAQVTEDIIGQALTVASGAQAVESLRVFAEAPRADSDLPPALIPAEEWQRIEATAKSVSDAAYSDALASEAGAYLYARQKSPQYCACGATVAPGESHPTGAGHDVMPEFLTRDEAEDRLRDAGYSYDDIQYFLDPATARQRVKDPPSGSFSRQETPILSAYVRGLNAKPEHTRITGYMSRQEQEGVDETDFVYTARRGGVTTRREHAAVLPLADAFEAMRATVPDVRIVAVAEDGTETPCMNYQEALGTLLAARDAIRAELQSTHGQKVSRTSPLAGVRRGALLELLRMLGGL